MDQELGTSEESHVYAKRGSEFAFEYRPTLSRCRNQSVEAFGGYHGLETLHKLPDTTLAGPCPGVPTATAYIWKSHEIRFAVADFA